jgi:uncharacterized protein YcgI (DUF1989 family)
MNIDTEYGHTCHANADKATLPVGLEDVQSVKKLFAFKIVNLSDETTSSLLNTCFQRSKYYILGEEVQLSSEIK